MREELGFTDEEWALLKRAPQLAALAIVLAHPTTVSTTKAIIAINRLLPTLKARHQNDPLIAAVLDDASGAPRIDRWDATRAEALATEMVKELAETGRILDAHAPRGGYREGSSARELKEMLYLIAITVAEASGEGFLGTGPKVSEREHAMLRKIRRALRLA